MQMLSDLLDREVNVMDEAEASSRGAAIAVFQALGYLENLDSAPMPAIKAKFSPDSERHRIYRAAMGRHLALYRTLVNPNPTI
jgi:sugar (pentulose or hexulose) kinase